MKYFSLLILIFIGLNTTAQQHDNVWPIGYHYCSGCAIPILDFTYGRPDTAGIYSPIDLFYTNTSICDSSGLLQFYTNGIWVANKYGQILPGSQDFNLDSAVVHFGWTAYMPFFQCAIAVPFPGHPNQYCLFHVSGRDWNMQNFVQPMRMAYSIIDMSANGGAGQMVLKNSTVFADTLLYSTMQAVKHANGRDWWIVSKEYNSNGLYAALLTPDSIATVVHSNSGPYFRRGNTIGQTKFSPDGTKFAWANRDSSLIYLYMFDRCTGVFTFDTLIRHAQNANGFNLVSCVFSPNSRYLYASDYFNIYQFDTYATDIPGSEKTVGVNDGSTGPFFRLNNGPDGKIYENTWGSYRYLHVINDPDQPDTACHFVAAQLPIMNYASSLPDFPNYRLGELYSSVCDSLTNNVLSTSHQTEINVYPNPSTGIFRFNLPENIHVNEIIITDITGRTILFNTLKNEIDLSGTAEGIYFYYFVSSGGESWKGTLIKDK